MILSEVSVFLGPMLAGGPQGAVILIPGPSPALGLVAKRCPLNSGRGETTF